MHEFVELWPPTPRTICHLQKASPPAFLTDKSGISITIRALNGIGL
jgi:hypothetical protein